MNQSIAVQPQLAKYLSKFQLRKYSSKKYYNSLVIYSNIVKNEQHDEERAAKILKRAFRVGACAGVLKVDSESQKIIGYKSCGDRFCPICAHRKAMEVYHVNQEIVKRCPGRYLFFTFTLPNCYGDFLAENVNFMWASFKKWRQNVSFDRKVSDGFCYGGLAALEVTYNPDLDAQGKPAYHPHIHYIAHVTDEYFDRIVPDLAFKDVFRPYAQIPPGTRSYTTYTYKNGSWAFVEAQEKSYSSQYKWSAVVDALRLRWMQILKLPVQPGCPLLQCDITVCQPDSSGSIDSSLLEVGKYMLKDTEYLRSPRVIGVLLEQLSGQIQYKYSGDWRKVASVVKAEFKKEWDKTQVLRTSENDFYLVADPDTGKYSKPVKHVWEAGCIPEEVDDVEYSYEVSRKEEFRRRQCRFYEKCVNGPNSRKKKNNAIGSVKKYEQLKIE